MCQRNNFPCMEFILSSMIHFILQKQLIAGSSLDQGDDLSEDTKLMYEKYSNKMDESKI